MAAPLTIFRYSEGLRFSSGIGTLGGLCVVGYATYTYAYYAYEQTKATRAAQTNSSSTGTGGGGASGTS